MLRLVSGPVAAIWIALGAVGFGFSSTSVSAQPTASSSSSYSASAAAASSASSSSSASNSISTNVIYVNNTALASLPLPFGSRTFNAPYYISSNGSSLSPSLSSSQLTNASSSSINAIQVFDSALAGPILGNSPSIQMLVYEPGYAFAHEAPVYFPDTGDIYFCSDAGGPEGRSNSSVNNKVFKIHLDSAQSKLQAGQQPTFANDVHEVVIDSDDVQMTNGGTNYRGNLLLANSGRTASYPPSIALIDRANPASNVQVLVNNAAGKQFTSLNDVVVHPTSGAIFFTDAWYGETQGFRPSVDLPLSVWRYDPTCGLLTAVTDPSIVAVPNGLAFNPDGTKLYVTDTGPIYTGATEPNATRPASIYEFDVHSTPSGDFQWLGPKRLFAWPSTGIADGVRVDNQGNVYSGTGDGLQIWSKEGKPIAKIFLPQTGDVNLAFAGNGRIVTTAQERLFLIQLNPSLEGPPIWDYPYSK